MLAIGTDTGDVLLFQEGEVKKRYPNVFDRNTAVSAVRSTAKVLGCLNLF